MRLGKDGAFSVFVTPSELSNLRGAARVNVPRLRSRGRAAKSYRVKPVLKLAVPAGTRARLRFKDGRASSAAAPWAREESADGAVVQTRLSAA